MRRAFTLIELLVSMGVMLSVLSIMAFGLRDAYRRQNLYGSAERVRQAFLRAKTNVQSGRKDCQLCGANPATTPPYACGSGDVSLSGWLVELGANEIITEGICGGSVFESRTERLPAGILLYYSQVNAVLFKPLGSGTDLESGLAVAIGGSGLDIYRGFTVTSDGEGSDLADVTPVPTPTAGSATPTPTRTPTPTPGGATSTPTRTPTPTVVSNMVASQITESSDDAEQTESSGVVDLGSSDLEFDQDGAAPQMIGLRFNNMTVPLNATITGAYVEFTVDELWGGPTSVSFFGEVSDNPTTFTTAAYNISSRPRTTARVDWNNIPAWDSTTGTAIGDKKQSPDISPIIQELVNRPGWVSGNSMVLIIDGPNAGGRRTTDVSGVTGPRLVVTYALEVPATPTPTITPTPTPYCTIGAVTTPSPLNLVVGGAAGSLQSNVTVVGSATVNQVNFNPSPGPAGAFGVSAALDTTLPYQTNVTAFASGNGNIQQVAQLSSGGNCAVLTPVTVSVPTPTATGVPTPTPTPYCTVGLSGPSTVVRGDPLGANIQATMTTPNGGTLTNLAFTASGVGFTLTPPSIVNPALIETTVLTASTTSDNSTVVNATVTMLGGATCATDAFSSLGVTAVDPDNNWWQAGGGGDVTARGSLRSIAPVGSFVCEPFNNVCGVVIGNPLAGTGNGWAPAGANSYMADATTYPSILSSILASKYTYGYFKGRIQAIVNPYAVTGNINQAALNSALSAAPATARTAGGAG